MAREERAREEHVMLEINRLFSKIMVAAVVIMVPWTAFLAVTLPGQYHAHNWDVAWVGFDTALMLLLIGTAWAAWYRRQILAMISVVAATMLLCDAWFDINTSWGTSGLPVSILTAVIGNIPLSIFFFWMARRIMLRTAMVVARATHAGNVPQRAIDVTFPFAVTWPEAFARPGHDRAAENSDTPLDRGDAGEH
ncbi:MAG: hypothetical protein ACP5PB_08740 [Acidimicrobiales bacterium]